MLIKKFFICFLIFLSLTVYAKNVWMVKDIKFNGLINIEKKDALRDISFHIGDAISQNDIRASIKRLFKTGKYEDIKVIFSQKEIIFNVHERPLISNITIVGNDIINSVILNKYLTELNIKKGAMFNSFTENIFIKTLKEFYNDMGRCKFDVTISKQNFPHNIVNLTININEGLPIQIKEIKIFGAKKISEKEIISLFRLRKHFNLWNFFRKSIYSSPEFNIDLQKLNDLYLNQGYFYFKIDDKKIHYLKDNNVEMAVYLSEGEQYKISNVFINGNAFEYKKIIQDIINIHHNELYNKQKINTIVNQIKRYLFEHGYIDSEISVIPEINYANKTIVLNFNIDVKNKFFVKNISFRGNELTNDRVLRRLIKQIEGKYFNIKLIEDGKELLEKTKYFNTVEIIQNKIPNESNQVNIIYKVQEQSTGSINFGLGYGIDSGLSLNASLSESNIFGSGNFLKSSIIKNRNQKYIDMSVSYPYFIFGQTDLNTRLFYNDSKYNFNSISNFTKNTYGFESNIGFPVNDNNKLNIGVGYSHNNIFNTENNIVNSSLINDFFNENALNTSIVHDFTLNSSWMYDTFKYDYFPISGNQTYISEKNTVPGSDNNFYKIILDSEQYFPLNQAKTFIFLSHIHMGIGNGFNHTKLPFYENFYMNNGVNNIRGFRSRAIGPKTIYNQNNVTHCIGRTNNNRCESIDSIGGNTTLSANLELITPIPLLDEIYSKFFRPSIFFDAGNIWDMKLNDNVDSFKLFKKHIINDIYASFGLSLQWFSPIGPLVFSYAIPIQKYENYQLEAFQFNVGKNW